jgi:hypothetical protein
MLFYALLIIRFVFRIDVPVAMWVLGVLAFLARLDRVDNMERAAIKYLKGSL